MDRRMSASSMRQINPSPIASPLPTPDTQIPYAIDEPTISSKSSGSHATRSSPMVYPGLHGSHGAIFYLTRIQRYSSYAFSLFTALHLCNVSIIPAVTRSVAGSETYLLQTREIYQTTITEPLLVGLPILAHVGSGLALRVLRRSQNIKWYGGKKAEWNTHIKTMSSGWPALSYISSSGYVFTMALIGHTAINRTLPLMMDGGSSNVGLAFVAHGFARHPLTASFAYAGLIAIASSHMVWGGAKWLGLAPSTKGWQGGDNVLVDSKVRRQRRRKWLGLHGIAAAVTALWAIGGLGVVARGGASVGWLGQLYDDLFTSVGF